MRNTQTENANLKEEGIFSSERRQNLNDYIELITKIDPSLKNRGDLLRENLKRLFESSVRLTVMQQKTIIARGTGFFVNDGGAQILVTVGHIISEAEHKKEKSELEVIATTYAIDDNQNITSNVQLDTLMIDRSILSFSGRVPDLAIGKFKNIRGRQKLSFALKPPRTGTRLVTVGNPIQYTRDGSTHESDNEKLNSFWNIVCSVFEKNSEKNVPDNYYQKVMANACRSDINGRKNNPPIVPYDTHPEKKTTFEELARIYFSTGVVKSIMDYHVITDVDGMAGFSGGPLMDIVDGTLVGMSVLTVQPVITGAGNELDFSSVPSYLIGELLKTDDLKSVFAP